MVDGFRCTCLHWLCGPLRDRAEELQDLKRLVDEGFFHSVPIYRMSVSHVSGIRPRHYYLCKVLIFQGWP